MAQDAVSGGSSKNVVESGAVAPSEADPAVETVSKSAVDKSETHCSWVMYVPSLHPSECNVLSFALHSIGSITYY